MMGRGEGGECGDEFCVSSAIVDPTEMATVSGASSACKLAETRGSNSLDC